MSNPSRRSSSFRFPVATDAAIDELSKALGMTRTQVVCTAIASLSKNPNVETIRKARKKIEEPKHD